MRATLLARPTSIRGLPSWPKMPSAGAPSAPTPSPARKVPVASKTPSCATPLLVTLYSPRVLPLVSTSMNFCAVIILGAAAASTARVAKIWPETAPPTSAAARVSVTNPIRSLMVMVAVSFPVPTVRRFSRRTLAGLKGRLQNQGPAPGPDFSGFDNQRVGGDLFFRLLFRDGDAPRVSICRARE